ncbi:MAG: leucyl aminopeptidase [Leptospira sp.]|nr:leucyl aminopeptidase [Leptospira sp.]
MKIESSKLHFSVGKSKGSHYKIFHIFKEDAKKHFKKKYSSIVDEKIFSGDAGQQLLLHAEKIIYIGLGEKAKFQPRKLASSYIKLGEQLIKWKEVGLEIHIDSSLSEKISPDAMVYHISTSLSIGAFPVDLLSKSYRERKITPGNIYFVLENQKDEDLAKKGLRKSNVVSRHVNGTRHIQHLPANYFTPEEFVSRSKEIASENKLRITVFDEDRLKKEKFGGILAVCEGSDKKPKMIILEYNPAGSNRQKKLALIGKGLTFDAGGISIKPAGEMHEMKYDMSGAAVAIHTIAAIAELGLKIPVIAAIGVAENMPDAAAIKPGDVYTAYNGITVEVQNTDAEGRLVLGDVISYVCKKYQPEYMIDLATLTGAVIVALGHEAAGLLCNSPEFTEQIKKAALTSEDRVWELPLWEEYGEDLKSDIADIRNITGGKGGGTLSAAQFLSRFVEGDVKWAHLDIAGTAWRGKASGTQCNGPTGYGIRLLVDLAETLSREK